jgi:virulence factor
MIRLGVVDFDSSHSIEFTQRFNQVGVAADQFVEGARVVLGCPGESLMAPERIPGFLEQVKSCDVELVERPEDMLGRIDAVLVLSLCGTAHRNRVTPFLEAGIPAFVDKPFACSVADAEAMVELADTKNTVLYHSSALRFCEEVGRFNHRIDDYGKTHGVLSYGPAKRAEGNPGLFHYGIHPTEVLFTVMGLGCRRVATCFTGGAELVTAEWDDGRIATLRGNRDGSTAYGFVAFCENGVIDQPISAQYAYRNLCRSMVETFKTGTPAVDHETNLQIVRFIAASMRSEQRDGAWETLA